MDFTNVLSSTFTLVLLALLALSFVLLCLYYGLIWLRTGRYSKSPLPTPDTVAERDLPSVSVVVVAHNEAESLKKSLPYLLEQDYPDYEVVVVDYTSQDDTPFVLRVCSENYPNLKPVSFPADVNMFKAINNQLINDGCGLFRGRQILPFEHLSRFQNDLID